MKIGDILKQELIVADLQGTDKPTIFEEMATHLKVHAAGFAPSPNQIVSALLTREGLGSTGVGEGVAIPHAKISGLKALRACFGRKTSGIVYDAIDNQPVRLIFMLLVPEHFAGVHLKALARVSRLLKDPLFRDTLLRAPSSQVLYDAFVAEDAKHQHLLV